MEMQQSSIVHADREVGVNDPTALAVVLTDANSQFTIEQWYGGPGHRQADRTTRRPLPSLTRWPMRMARQPWLTYWQIELPGGLCRLQSNENGHAAPCRLADQ